MNSEDRFGQRIEAGDTVHFVYGGDEHSMEVTGVDQDGPHTVLEGRIPVRIHDKTATRVKRGTKGAPHGGAQGKPKAEPKKSAAAEKPAAAEKKETR